MFIIMILAGALSTMSVWADKLEDVRYSLNDAYMILLMCGWMIFFMGLYYKEAFPAAIGAAIAIVTLFAIRKQLFITQDQYIKGMIPHHSMAVLMSRRLLEKGTAYRPFVDSILQTQQKEIIYMNSLE